MYYDRPGPYLRLPLAMMAIESPRISASSMEWVVMIVTRFFLERRIRFQMSRRIFGSIPVQVIITIECVV